MEKVKRKVSSEMDCKIHNLISVSSINRNRDRFLLTVNIGE